MYHKHTHIHFMGIGGIGMSGIAKILAHQGYQVSGCDLDLEQKSVKQLQAIGCVISAGHNGPACHDESIDVLVYSTAVKLDHPEMVAARTRGVRIVHRATMLAELMRTCFSVSVAGAHGKTTTTSLISHILLEAQLDPTVVIGGHLKNIDDNAHAGNGNILVAEADESDRSFLRLPTTWAVITNIDLEHLDTYKDLDDIKATFKQFVCQLPFYGKAIVCIDDPVIASMLPFQGVQTITYGLSPHADVFATDVQLNPTGSTCTVYAYGKKLGCVQIPVAGRFNVLNALGAIALARDLQIPFDTVTQAIATFQGVDRRFSYHGTYKGAELFDDYGHHPREIANMLQVARTRAHGKLHVIFQPHRFTRTYHLWNEFIDMFVHSDVDHLVITDIYPASEAPIEQVTAQRLVADLQAKNPSFVAHYVPLDDDFTQLIKHLETHVAPGDLVLFQGAGCVYQIPHKLIESKAASN